jgi:hypothetical protein
MKPEVFKVSHSISSSEDLFHLVVEAFGDSICFREPPHSDDFFLPFLNSLAERFHMFEPRFFQYFDGVYEVRNELLDRLATERIFSDHARRMSSTGTPYSSKGLLCRNLEFF